MPVPSRALTPSRLLTPSRRDNLPLPDVKPNKQAPDPYDAPYSALRNGQYELDRQIAFGTRTPYAVPNDFLVQQFGTEEASVNNHDAHMPNEDGTIFGTDTMEGMNLFWKVNLWKKGEPALDDLARFSAIWKDPAKRDAYNELSTIRIAKQDRIRRVYGRPRRFQPEYGMVEHGWCPIDIDFKCVDNTFWDDQQDGVNIRLAYPPTSGLRMPFTAPLRTSQRAPSYGSFVIEGDKPTWPTFTLYGPITNPVIEIIGAWKFALNVSLNKYEWLTVDPRPWRRMTLQNGAINLAGRYTIDSIPMKKMQLKPGAYAMTLSGYDLTLSAQCLLGWRNAYSAP